MSIEPGLSRIRAKRDLLINGQLVPVGSEYVCGDVSLAAVCGDPGPNNPNYEMLENGHVQYIKTQADQPTEHELEPARRKSPRNRSNGGES